MELVVDTKAPVRTGRPRKGVNVRSRFVGAKVEPQHVLTLERAGVNLSDFVARAIEREAECIEKAS